MWARSGLLARAESPFVAAAARLLKNSLELVTDAEPQLRELLDYPLDASASGDDKAADVLADDFAEVQGPCSGAVHQPTGTYLGGILLEGDGDHCRLCGMLAGSTSLGLSSGFSLVMGGLSSCCTVVRAASDVAFQSSLFSGQWL